MPGWRRGAVRDTRQAAARELLEEAGRSDPIGAELFTWEHDFPFAGAPVHQRETYFLSRADDIDLPANTPDACDGIERRAWLTLEGIAALVEPLWPPDLLARLRASEPVGG